MIVEVIGQICGVAAVCVSFAIYQLKNRRRFIQFKLVIDILWTSHFLLIGSIPAFVTTGLAISREVVFMNKDKKWAKSKWWVVLFISIFLTSSIFTWKNVYSVIPAIASSLTTLAFWSSNVIKIKLFLFPASLGMLIYNIQAQSIAGIVNEIISELSIVAYFIINYYWSYKRRNKHVNERTD